MNLIQKPRFTFARKLSALIVVLILLSGTAITLSTGYHFRDTLRDREIRRTYTAFMAAMNYLQAHYRSHQDVFDRRTLNYVLRTKFMMAEGAPISLNSSRPTALTIYNTNQVVLYAFGREQDARLPPHPTPAQMDGAFHHWFQRAEQALHIVGPIASDGSVPGLVHMVFPTDLYRELKDIYVELAGMLLAVLLFSTGLSLLFARRSLSPVAALIKAVQRAHDGDFSQRVPVMAPDDIGMLASTFNSMMDALTRRLDLMRLTQEWTVRLAREFDLKRLYETLMDMFERTTQGTFSLLYISGSGPGGLDLAAHRGGRTLSLGGDQMVRMAHQAGASLYLKADEHMEQSPAGALECALPLVAGAKKVGVIRVGRREDGRPYDEDTTTTLATLAQVAAVAIDNTRLYLELSRQERFEQEMKWARDIQSMLLPRHLPVLAHYQIAGASQPASEVGGDYYDVVKVAGGRWHLYVGDVSGKGVPAALIMSMVRSLIHSGSDSALTPEAILKKINRHLSPDLDEDMFVTVAAVDLDPANHRVRLVRAGHEPMLLMKQAGAVRRLEPRGAAMGLIRVEDFDRALQAEDVELERGDLVLLYSDGVTETRDRAGQEFGYARLEQLLAANRERPAQELVQMLLGELRSFAAGQAQQDDITILALRRTD